MQVPEPGNPVRGRNIHQEFILHVLEDVECGKAVALIVGKGVLGVNVPVDRLHAFLFHQQALKFRAEERVQRCLPERFLPCLDGLVLVAGSFVQSGLGGPQVGLVRLIVVSKDIFHQQVGSRSLGAEDMVVHASVRSAEAAFPFPPLHAHRVRAVAGLPYRIGRDAVGLGRYGAEVGEAAADAADDLRVFRSRVKIPPRHVEKRPLNGIAKEIMARIGGGPAGGRVPPPGEVDMFVAPFVGFVVPGTSHDEAHFPWAQFDESRMQLVFLMQFFENPVAAHRIAVGGVGFKSSRYGAGGKDRGQSGGQGLVIPEIRALAVRFPDVGKDLKAFR